MTTPIHKMALSIEMSDRHINILTKVRNQYSSSVQLCRRIDIILLAYEGATNTFIAEKIASTHKTVRGWRSRWVENYEHLQIFEKGINNQGVTDLELKRYLVASLKDAQRKGAPKKFTPSQEQQIIALACQKPIEHGVEMTDWTHEMLAKIAILKNIVPTISSSQVGRLLKNKPTSTAEIRILAISPN